MICPICQTRNPDGSKFCNECGAKLPAPCPNCGHHNPEGAKFCNQCGFRLPAAEESPPASVEPARPSGVPAQARRPGAPVQEGERRTVTALFCDISGSTSAAEQLDPEEWTEIMNGAFEEMIGPVQRYDGTVVRLLGDAILAFFGAPVAHEDDPRRAVMAGLEIQARMRPYRARAQQEWGVEIDVRCGINTGLAVVGAIGSDTHVEYTALGDAVNVAARMEQTAEPGTVQISVHTYRLVAPIFEVEPLGEVEAKGKDEPISAYRVVRARAAPGRVRGIEGLQARLTGRDQELSQLQGMLDDLVSGDGSVVFLTGEAGLGKSRLIREVRAASDEAVCGVDWFLASSLSYEMARPYGQIQRLMRSACGIVEDAPAPEVYAGIERALEHAPPEHRDATRHVLETLFDVADASAGAPRLEGETFKGQLYVTMHALWTAWAQAGPVVLVFDDLHWADQASVELLGHLLTVVDNAPILILCAMRPDQQSPGWSLKSGALDRMPERSTEIALRALSPAESDALLTNMMLTDWPQSLREQVLEKTAGNPLFVEEVVRTLIDSGAVRHDAQEDRWTVADGVSAFHVPDSIQSLLMARIDRLDSDVRQTLQLAAVIGRSFDLRVLREIAGQNGSVLDGHMAKLQQSGLIDEAEHQPVREFVFRHVLAQETAYSTILHRQRRAYHRRVGEALEALFPNNLDEHAVELAYHFDRSDEAERALHYHTLAGDAAFRLYSHEEAIGHYDRALELALRQADGGTDISDERLRHLFLRRGRSLELHERYRDALANYVELAELGDRRASRVLTLASLLASATLYSTQTPVADDKLGKSVGEESLRLAQTLGDRRSEAQALWNLMNFHNFFLGAMEEAARYGEAALAIATELDLKEQLAYVQNDLHWIYVHLGNLARARTLLEESEKLWRELGNLPMLVDNLFGSTTFHIFTGNLDRALIVAEEGAQIAESIRNVWNQSALRGMMAVVHRLRGDYGAALAVLEQSIAQSGDDVRGIMTIVVWDLLALIYAELGAVQRGLETSEQIQRSLERVTLRSRVAAFHAAFQAKLLLLNGDVAAAEEQMRIGATAAASNDLFSVLGHVNPFVMCELALAQSNFDRVVQLVDEFCPVYSKEGASWALPEFRYLKALALRGQGDTEGAKFALDQARAEAEEMGLRRIHWQILAALAELMDEEGDDIAAEELRAEARALLDQIARGLPGDEWRETFRAESAVRRILEP